VSHVASQQETTQQEPAQKSAAADILRQLYGPIEQQLGEVEALLRRELRSQHPCVDEMVRHGVMIGGKRLRPALVLLSAMATGQLNSSHILLGAVVEMIHTATLVHDDVLDEASIRRHLDTCNARWDNEASVLLGDYLFTHSFALASTLDSTFACQVIGRSTNTVCEGELRQLRNRENFSLTEEEYLGIIEAKTAELCACSCLLGAHYADAEPDVAEQLCQYGRNLGIAFQIVDDLLDVAGSENKMGKSLGTDLEKQKPTLPVIHILQQASEEQRAQIIKILCSDSANRREQLSPWFERFGAIEYTRQMASDYAGKARGCIEIDDDNPAQKVLWNLTEFVVGRSH